MLDSPYFKDFQVALCILRWVFDGFLWVNCGQFIPPYFDPKHLGTSLRFSGFPPRALRLHQQAWRACLTWGLSRGDFHRIHAKCMGHYGNSRSIWSIQISLMTSKIMQVYCSEKIFQLVRYSEHPTGEKLGLFGDHGGASDMKHSDVTTISKAMQRQKKSIYGNKTEYAVANSWHVLWYYNVVIAALFSQ